MAKRKVLDDSDVKAIVQVEIQNCDGSGSQLSQERTENLDFYFCRPFGNEQEGRSKVVSADVRDTIEWVKPILMRMFTSGENVCEFEPEEPQDIDAAKQATEYVNFQWNRDNPGFLNFYTWFTDGLLSKNGVIKIYWNKLKRTKRERYSGLDDEQFATLVNDKSVTVSEHTETAEQQIAADLRPEGFSKPVAQEVTKHDVVLTRQIEQGKVCVDPVPPEEFLISNDARSIADARMVGHKRKRTLSDLIEDGFDRARVESLASDDDESDADAQAVARDSVEETAGLSPGSPLNKAMREVWVYEVYLKIDVDGDGIAEMRKITVAGPGYEVLSNDAWDAPVPFVSLTPIILPHRFYGMALADLAKYFQILRSTILRQYLDNLYLSNNQREEVVVQNIIDPAEALSNKPGQRIRVKAPQSVVPILTPQIGAAALEGLNYLDQLKENATGVSARTQGLGSNDLHDTAKGEQMLMTAAMGKIELIARVYAETGVKEAFRLIHKLNCMYQDKPRVVRLTGKDFVPVDPRSWNADMDMTVSVGIGTGDQQAQLQGATAIGTLQKELAALGMVTPQNAMETAEMVVNAVGQKGVERFFTLPDPNAPKPPDPEMAKVQAKAAADQAALQQKGQLQEQQNQQDFRLEIAKMQQEFALKMEQLRAELGLKREEIYIEAGLEHQRIQQAPEIENIKASAKIPSQVRVGGEPG